MAPARVEVRKRARIEKNRILRLILLELRLNSFLTSCSVLRCRDHMAATTLLRENREKLDKGIIKLITDYSCVCVVDLRIFNCFAASLMIKSEKDCPCSTGTIWDVLPLFRNSPKIGE
jgi:hypothetical protein